jgi:hypothetical protein
LADVTGDDVPDALDVLEQLVTAIAPAPARPVRTSIIFAMCCDS